MNQIEVKITGATPLLMHSDRGANPLSPEVIEHKQLTGKRKKTEDDLIEIAKSEWFMSLYLNDDKQVILPSSVIFAGLIAGAKKNKLGTAVMSGVQIPTLYSLLDFPDKDKSVDDLWGMKKYTDCRSVVVSRARLMRYRPVFQEWSATFKLLYDETVIDESNIMMAFQNAGMYVGLCDFRPAKGGQFGRFTVEKL